MATFRLDDLRLRAQEESDNVNSAFLSNAEWTRLLNASYTELYGLLVNAFEDYYVKAPPYSFVTDGTNSQFNLPTDFYKLLGVDLQVQSTNFWVTLKSFAFNERNRFGLLNAPAPQAGQTLRLWYVPAITPLAADADVTVDIQNGWEEYIVVDSAMKALLKEESDISGHMARKQMLKERINSEATNRDAGMPHHIVDVYKLTTPSMQYKLNANQLWLIGGTVTAPPYQVDDYNSPMGGFY